MEKGEIWIEIPYDAGNYKDPIRGPEKLVQRPLTEAEKASLNRGPLDDVYVQTVFPPRVK